MIEKDKFLLFLPLFLVLVFFLVLYLMQCRWVQQCRWFQFTIPQHKGKVMQKMIETVRYVTVKVTIKHPDDSDADDIIDECDYRLQPDPTNGFHVVMETEMIDVSEECPL